MTPMSIEARGTLFDLPDQPGAFGYPVDRIKRALTATATGMRGIFPDAPVDSQIRSGIDIVAPDGFTPIVSEAGPIERKNFRRKGLHRGKNIRKKRKEQWHPAYASFSDWRMDLVISYSTRVWDAGRLVSFLSYVGQLTGLGQWRPLVAGDNGTFNIIKAESVDDTATKGRAILYVTIEGSAPLISDNVPWATS